MASKLCCTIEQESRSGSPELPNARPSAVNSAKPPLLPKPPGSPNSRFTSVRTAEFHELHQIFNHAQNDAEEQATPMRSSRTRFSRVSAYSLHRLHSLQKMTSMRSLIKRRFSRDLLLKDSEPKDHSETSWKATTGSQDTVVMPSKLAAKQQLKLTKLNLRKNLLSDKKAEEGGYDSDAQMFDDLAANIGKKVTSKRASIHSVNWSPSTCSNATPESSTRSRTNAACDRALQPYQTSKLPAMSLATRIGQVFSTPNLRVDVSDGKNHAFRRSQSATSMELPHVPPLSPLSPLRLPSLTNHDQDRMPWVEAINESLRLSQFPVPPCHVCKQTSQTVAPLGQMTITSRQSKKPRTDNSLTLPIIARNVSGSVVPQSEIRIRQSTSIVSPRPSTSAQGRFIENAQSLDAGGAYESEAEEDCDSQHSVHLCSMRISHHLRSGSLLSWEQLTDAPEFPSTIRSHRGQCSSGSNRLFFMNQGLVLHGRQTSSSGFTSTKVPSKWGKVLPGDHRVRDDKASSIYSSPPQSPSDSFVASLASPGWTGVERGLSVASIETPRPRRSNSFPTDDEETPRAKPRNNPSNPSAVRVVDWKPLPLATPVPLARKNSAIDTKKSKFREEFSPSLTRKRNTPPGSIMKLLNPKRLSARSRSEISLEPDHPFPMGDAAFDTLEVPTDRERRQSQSMISLRTEQSALGKHRGAEQVWDQALKAHQEEKASLFLPKNRDLAVHASPFRERSGSVMTRHSTKEADATVKPTALAASNASEGLFDPLFTPAFMPHSSRPDELPCNRLFSRRRAMLDLDKDGFGKEVSAIFEKQGDNPDIVGAWGRYPSHTRSERTKSARKVDRVESRDFAVEAAAGFMSTRDVDDDMIDPIDRGPSMPLMLGEKKRKKKVGGGRMAKSNSMTFGKNFFKNYTRIFKSSSAEFRQHGRNHRSSIATGGVLEFPELELLPEIWKPGPSVDGNNDPDLHSKGSLKRRRASDSLMHNEDTSKPHDSMTTLRPRRNSSAPILKEHTYDGVNDNMSPGDKARVWSIYYDDCVPSYPRHNTGLDADPKDSGPARFSFESRYPSMHPHTVPAHFARHSRNGSRVSRTSVISQGTVYSSFNLSGQDDGCAEKRSVISVRRSTMDLISRFKQQEVMERERVLSITRAD